MKYPRLCRRLDRTADLLLLGCVLGLAGIGTLRADNRVTVRGKASPEYTAWKFGSGEIKNETYVFNQGRFFGGTTRDRPLENLKFIDLAKSLAIDLVGQHYYPSNSLRMADLLIIVEWGVTTKAESVYEQFARDNPVGMSDTDAGRRETMHQLAVSEREAGGATSALQMLDQGYDMSRVGGLVNDAQFQELDRKSMSLGLASNAALVGFDDDLRADSASAFGTLHGEMLRAFMADERYFVALNAYDCQEFLKTNKFQLVWSMRLSMRAPGMDFRKGVGLMSVAGRAAFGHKTDGVEIRMPREKSAQVDIGTPVVIQMDAHEKK